MEVQVSKFYEMAMDPSFCFQSKLEMRYITYKWYTHTVVNRERNLQLWNSKVFLPYKRTHINPHYRVIFALILCSGNIFWPLKNTDSSIEFLCVYKFRIINPLRWGKAIHGHQKPRKEGFYLNWVGIDLFRKSFNLYHLKTGEYSHLYRAYPLPFLGTKYVERWEEWMGKICHKRR